MTILQFSVIGLPKPQGSKRHVGNGIMVESAGAPLKDWRSSVAAAAHNERVRRGGGFTGPVRVDLWFVLPRPKSAPKRFVAASKRPDIDKLSRAVLDALTTSALIADDSLVVDLRASKMLASPDGGSTGCAISIREMLG